ncbi:MAG: PD40 domain-containing protein, partial [Bacteroidetes bacterium]|nr:PD40 domain-containing protein [Bacteroidota bacterium]
MKSGTFTRLSLICLVLLLPVLMLGQEEEANNDSTKKKKGLTLEPGRTISFDQTEGTWISLDVSPDGKTLVFDFLGDLYTMPISGGTATSLTSGMAFDGQPRFSPDGKSVVYTSDKSGGENIWIINLETKEETQLTEGNTDRYQSPEWTPDGEYIIASKAGMRSGPLTLWLYHKDGGKGVKLIDKPDDLKTTGAAFNQDDRYIWFAERRRDWSYNAIFPQYQLATYDRETGKKNTITSRYGSAIRPTLSPDGKWLVYGTRHDSHTGLIKRNLQTGEENWLAYPIQHDDQESRGTRDVLPGMSFTPDSKDLVVSYGGKIWRLPIDGGEAREISFRVKVDLEVGPRLDFDYPIEDSKEIIVKQIRDLAPSPDGKKLAFTALNRLYVMDLPEGTPRRLTTAAYVEAQPTWSPDGKWLAYVSWEGGEGNIYKVSANGGTPPQKLTSKGGYYQTPAWAPEGEKIVFIKDSPFTFKESIGSRASSSNSMISWIGANGGEITDIIAAQRRDYPHFDSKGERIYLNASGGELVSIRWDGSDEKSHVKITGEKAPGLEQPTSAKRIMVSPDGKSVLAEVYWDVYWVHLPYVGGETQKISVSSPDKATFPAKKLSDIGGQFAAWESSGTRIHWGIGNAHVVYDLAEAKDSSKYEPLERRIEVKAPRDIPQGQVVLKNARIITMKGNEILEKGDILIKDNRIEKIGPAGSFRTPGKAKEIDLTGKTIVPGFV